MDIKGESLGFNWSESMAREEGTQKPAFNLLLQQLGMKLCLVYGSLALGIKLWCLGPILMLFRYRIYRNNSTHP